MQSKANHECNQLGSSDFSLISERKTDLQRLNCHSKDGISIDKPRSLGMTWSHHERSNLLFSLEDGKTDFLILCPGSL